MLERVRPLGAIAMPLGWKGGWRTIHITGGPFDAAPLDVFRVAVRAERIRPGEANVHLPIRDFSVPENGADVAAALQKTLQASLSNKPVYVGCMGGYGRTGLFLALLAKAAGIEDPVDYVRRHYHSRAVETEKQMQYVEDFDVSGIRKAMLGFAWGVTLTRACGLPFPK